MTTEGVREKSISDIDRRRGDESPKGRMEESGFPQIAEEDAVSGLVGLRDPLNVIRDASDSSWKKRMKRSDRVEIRRVPIHALNLGKKKKKPRSKSGAPRSDEGARGSAAKEIFASDSNPSRDSEKQTEPRSDEGARGSAMEIFASGSNPSRDSEKQTEEDTLSLGPSVGRGVPIQEGRGKKKKGPSVGRGVPIQEHRGKKKKLRSKSGASRSDEGARGSGLNENFVSGSNPEGRDSEKQTEEDTISLGLESFEETDGDEEDRERGRDRDEDDLEDEEDREGARDRDEDDLEDEEDDDSVLKDKSTRKRKGPQKKKQTKRQKTLVPLPHPVDISTRRVVRSVVIKPDFFISNSLSEIHDLLSLQKGFKEIFEEEEPERVSEMILREFYEQLVIEGDSRLMAEVVVGGIKSTFTTSDICRLIGGGDSGFYGYQKGRPTNVSIDGVKEKLAKQSGVTLSIMLQIIQKTLIPRERDTNGRVADATVLDIMLLGTLMAKEAVNLPALILNHMRYVRKKNNHALPYPTLVKRILILTNHGQYQPEQRKLAEHLAPTYFGVDNLKRLGIFNNGGSWNFDNSHHPPTSLETISSDIAEMKDLLHLILEKVG